MSPKSFLLPGVLAGLCLVLATPAFAAKVYQWKDAKGVTHYSDSPPPDQAIKGRNLADKGRRASRSSRSPSPWSTPTAATRAAT